MAYCGKCLHLDVCKTADSCDGHVPKCKHFMDKTIMSQMPGKPRTRGDQLRAMSDGPLAQVLTKAVTDGCPPDMDWKCQKDKEGWEACDKCWCKWLQQPAKE